MSIKACLIAVSNYDDARLKDIPCKNDLYCLKDALKRGLNVKESSIFLYGESGIVTKKDFVKAIAKMSVQCENEDILIFYFSGHGGKDGNIYLSDGEYPLQELIDCLKNLTHQEKVIILDCCYAGNFLLDGENNLDSYISVFNETNCAVLASCRSGETSQFNIEKQRSFYTSLLCDALTYKPLTRKGKKSLEEIVEFIDLLCENKNKVLSNKEKQHSVFRSSLKGTIYFNVEEYHPYLIEKFYLECENYIIYAVEPLHSSVKRYAVKVILRGKKDYNQISDYTYEIVEIVKNCNIFKNPQSKSRLGLGPAKIIFCYFGYDEYDAKLCNWRYRSIWVDEDQNRAYWYKTNLNSNLINDILVVNMNSIILSDRCFIRI